MFRAVPTLVGHENGSQLNTVSSLTGMEEEPSTWYSSLINQPTVPVPQPPLHLSSPAR